MSHARCRQWAPLVVACVLLWCIGCSGNHVGADGAVIGTSNFRLTIIWPQPGVLAQPPMSVRVVAISQDGASRTERVVNRPTGAASSAVEFAAIPGNTPAFTVTAYPLLDGAGDVLAQATTRITANPGETARATFVMGGPIYEVRVTPAYLALLTGASGAVTATAISPTNEVVLLPPGTFVWSMENPGIATVTADGLVTGVSAGTTQLTVTETGQQHTAQLTVDVAATTHTGLIAWTHETPGDTYIYVMRANGLNQHEGPSPGVQRNWAAAFNWLGTKLAITAADAEQFQDLYVMDPDGANMVRVTDEYNGAGGAYGRPAFDPTGTRVAFNYNGGIVTIGTDGSGRTQLTTDGGVTPTYTIDGRIIYAIPDYVADTSKLYIMKANGTGKRFLADGASPSASHAYDHVAFVRDEQVWVMNTSGGSPLRLTTDGGADPTYSPDGEWIAYAADGEIYTMSRLGEAKTRLTYNDLPDSSPSWGPQVGGGANVTIE